MTTLSFPLSKSCLIYIAAERHHPPGTVSMPINGILSLKPCACVLVRPSARGAFAGESSGTAPARTPRSSSRYQEKNTSGEFFPRFPNKPSHAGTGLPNLLVPCSGFWGGSFCRALGVTTTTRLRAGGLEPAPLVQPRGGAATGLGAAGRGREDEEPPFIFIVLVLNDRLLVLSTALLL